MECYLKDAICRKCNKKGHIEQVCCSRVHNAVPQNEPARGNSFQVNAASTETPSCEENEEYSLFTVHKTKDSANP